MTDENVEENITEATQQSSMAEFNLKALGEKFVRVREMLECTQEKMSEALDIDVQTLAKIENGEDVLTAEMDTRLADFFFYDALKVKGSKLREIHELDLYCETELRMLAYALLRHKMYIVTAMRLRRCGLNV